MQIHTLPLTVFRIKIGTYCREVYRGEKQLIIKRYYNDLFKVVALDDEAGIDFGLTDARNNTLEFLVALQKHKSIILSDRGVPLVKCILL
jgi:hypothetical protein